jgi:hypothetical protein
MKKVVLITLAVLLAFGGMGSLHAKKRKPKKSTPTPETQAAESLPVPPESAPGSLGSVIFFLDRRENLESHPGSVHVGEKDRVYFCVKLDPEDSRISRAMKYLRGVGLTLEGPGDNPQKIVGLTRFYKKRVEPEASGCYLGRLRVPFGIPPGKYKISELDLYETPNKAISLREELREFSLLGVIDVDSPNIDLNPPVVEEIVSWTPVNNHLDFRGHIGSARMNFRVLVNEAISGVRADTFKVFFKVYLDDLLVDIVEPKCKARLKNLYYDCHLYFSRSEPDIRAVTAKFVLDSISASDKLGNDLEITEPEKLASLFKGKRLVYTFYPTPSLQDKSDTNENKEKDLVGWPPVISPPTEKDSGDM